MIFRILPQKFTQLFENLTFFSEMTRLGHSHPFQNPIPIKV